MFYIFYLEVTEWGDDVRPISEEEAMVIVNHQSTGDVCTLMMCLQDKGMVRTERNVLLHSIPFEEIQEYNIKIEPGSRQSLTLQGPFLHVYFCWTTASWRIAHIALKHPDVESTLPAGEALWVCCRHVKVAFHNDPNVWFH